MNAFGYTVPDPSPARPPVLTDPPAHQYGIRRVRDGRWYYPAEDGTHRDDYWKLFPFWTWPSAIAAHEQAERLRTAGHPVEVKRLK
jgi:hypothetical protein